MTTTSVRMVRGFLIILVLWTVPLSAAEKARIAFHFSVLDNPKSLPKAFYQPGIPKPPLHFIELQLRGPGQIRLTGDFAGLKPDSYTLTAVEKGKAPTKVPIIAVAATGRDLKPGHARSIAILPQTLKKGVEYSITLPHILIIDGDDGVPVEVPPNTYPLGSKELEQNLKYTAPLALENKLEVLNGSGGGQASVHFHLQQNRFTEGDWLHVDFDAKADINLESKDKGRYFDSIIAELDAFHAYDWEFGDASASEQGHAEFGLSSRFESDRAFENINLTAGLTYEVYFKNRFTTGLHHLVAPKEAGVAPLFVVAYDYVGHISQSGDTPNTGNQRLRAGFYYSLPLFRSVQVPIFSMLMGSADGDFLIAAEVLYDAEKDMLTDNTKLTLDLRQHTEKSDGWAYNLTYARGRATPTYKNFDALLFGIKKWF